MSLLLNYKCLSPRDRQCSVITYCSDVQNYDGFNIRLIEKSFGVAFDILFNIYKFESVKNIEYVIFCGLGLYLACGPMKFNVFDMFSVFKSHFTKFLCDQN